MMMELTEELNLTKASRDSFQTGLGERGKQLEEIAGILKDANQKVLTLRGRYKPRTRTTRPLKTWPSVR